MALSSYWQRRIGRHLLLALASAAMLAIVYPNVPTDFILRRWNLATAYAALALLAATLLIGPWQRLRARPSPISQDLRRDVGIWAALMGVAHSIIGLGIHFGGKYWQYFLYGPEEPHEFPVRLDAIGLANYTGLGSTLLLLLLLAVSNDRALRRLGTERWKSVQRWNYAAFVLMAVHGAVYQLISNRVVPVVVVFAGVLTIVVGTQLAAFRRVRAGR